ncbi:MAG TPA: PAS domain S-box protein [Chloroflexi bacterium]|nr:PAS domain S-box protein [Chloroflexota bacterium]
MDTILLLMEKARDRLLLEDYLRDKYLLLTTALTSGDPFDLCILDGPALTHFRPQILARKHAARESYLPVLLVTTKRDVGLLTSGIWQVIDEVITSPIQKAELHARVEVLLRARRQAQALLTIQQQQLQQTQSWLRESEHKFALIFAKAGFAAALTRMTDGALVDVNEAFERISGYTRQEVIGKTSAELGLCPDIEARRLVMQELNVNGHIHDREILFCSKSGEMRTFSLNLDKLDIGGEPYILHTMQDTTERRRAENDLIQSETRFRNLFQNNHAVMLLIDPATGNIFDANPAASAYYGWDIATLRSMNIADINTLTPEEIKVEMERARTQQRNHFEFRHRRADGEVRDVEVYSGPIHMQDRDLLHSLIFDVTERKRLEEQLRQAQKMESVGQLAGGVAHDFNNMLAVILIQTELALMQLDPSHPLRNRFLEIRSAAERSAHLTQQLLAFARKQVINPQIIDLNDAVTNTLQMLRRLIGEDITLAWSPAPHLWPVKLDPGQLDQVLANLCVNARDAIAGVGSVLIEARNVTLDADYCTRHNEAAPGDYVLLSVSDTGCGIDQATLKRIFEPFFTTKEVGRGTGLGLATVYGIIRQNNGFINVYSEPGMGATFNIYLPRYHAEDLPATRSPEPDAIPAGHGETVLLVEDEPTMLEVTQMMLEQLGYRVLAAGAPSAALQLAAAHGAHIQLLLTDIIMPEMNGYELAEQLKRFNPEVRVVFMSGYSAAAISYRGIQHSEAAYVQKPFAIKELAAKIRALLT